MPLVDVIITNLVSLVPVLAAAYGVVLGVVALVTGWRLFCGRKPRRYRRRAVVPPVGATGRGVGGVR
ncbi:MAG: hypothetical protein ACRDRN_27895 [Sciscionella sp.]